MRLDGGTVAPIFGYGNGHLHELKGAPFTGAGNILLVWGTGDN